MDKRFAVVTSLVASVFLAASAVAVLAQDAATETSTPPAATVAASAPADAAIDKKLVDLWDNMLQNVRIARGDLARSYAQAILDLKPKAHDVYLLSVKSPDTLMVLKNRAAKLEGLKTLTDQVLQLIETGYQEDRSNPEQIAHSIAALSGSMQAFENASARLITSGEYAIPQMVQVLADPQSPRIQKELVASVLPRFSKESVNAMAAALESSNPAVIEELARALGRIGYRQAAPYLKAVLARPGILDSTKKAVDTALLQLVGKEGSEQTLAQLAYAAAQDYYNNDQSLVPGLQTTANVWSWQNDRLTYDRVPREIYTDIYAMQLSAMALKSDPKFYPAMSLWLASDFRREADLPNGATDPTMPANMPSARFFALASPPEILQAVLANGMKLKNAAVTLGAMEALVRTQGAKSLVQPVANGAQPLVEALRYPDRQVRYLAAISLANALPDKKINGSDQVVGIMLDALRGNSKKTALLVVLDDQQRNTLKEAIRAAGYEVIDEPLADKALVAAKTTAILDVVVVAGKAAGDVVAGMSADPVMSSIPVVVVGEDDAAKTLAKNEQVVLMGAADKIADVLARTVKIGGDALPADKGNAWAVRTAEATRLLAMTGNTAFDLNRLRPVLIDVVSSGAPEVQMAAAKSLAVMPNADAQQAIADFAVRAGLDEKTRIEALNVLTESVRKFGNQLSEAQVKSVYDLVVGTGTPALKEAAAQAWGSLNLPTEKSRALILQFSTKS